MKKQINKDETKKEETIDNITIDKWKKKEKRFCDIFKTKEIRKRR